MGESSHHYLNGSGTGRRKLIKIKVRQQIEVIAVDAESEHLLRMLADLSIGSLPLHFAAGEKGRDSLNRNLKMEMVFTRCAQPVYCTNR